MKDFLDLDFPGKKLHHLSASCQKKNDTKLFPMQISQKKKKFRNFLDLDLPRVQK